MKTRALDENHDWTFGSGGQNYKSAEAALAQDINTRLLSFYGDCFFDMAAGVNWLQMLDYNMEQNLQSAIENVILETEGVVGINEVSVYREGRNFRVSYDIKTIYSNSYQANLTTTMF